MSPEPHESHAPKFWSTPLRDLGLKIEGTALEPIVRAFREELKQRGITRVRPAFYLSTEWGVPWGSVSIAIPFYLARPELTDLHATHHGHVEGTGPADVLRYLRHEMGHVVNYAYRLYEDPEWVRLFGDINRAYVEEYRPRPFHPDYVVHLPGWYAQKHPDEDWAETFAVWMTPGLDWRARYARRPAALGKLEYCDRTMTRLRDRDPLVTAEDADEDVGGLGLSLEQFYHDLSVPVGPAPPGLDDALQTIFEAPVAGAEARPAAALVGRLERTLMADVYRWTGYFPERTRALLRQLAARAEERKLSYPAERELQVAVGLSAFVTALVMNQGEVGK